MTKTERFFAFTARATWLLCAGVVVLGAYVRLTDAGLGCPDWPGCYGEILVPTDHAAANAAYPERPLETGKAWREMIHRYFASGVGLGILLLLVSGPLHPPALHVRARGRVRRLLWETGQVPHLSQ